MINKMGKQSKLIIGLTLVFPFLFADCLANGNRAAKAPFFTRQHHFEVATSYIAYQPLKVSPVSGSIHLQPHVGHSYSFTLGYSYQHNDYFGLSIGAGLGKVMYAFSYSFEKSKINHPFAEEVFIERHVAGDLFFCIPVTARFNIPVHNTVSVLLEPGLQLTHHPRSLYEFVLGYRNLDTNEDKQWGNVYIYRNARAQPLYPVIVLNAGSCLKLPYGDYFMIKVISNIHVEDVVNGSYSFFNLGSGNDSKGSISMNTSFIGLQLQYVFVWNIAAYKNYTQGRKNTRHK